MNLTGLKKNLPVSTSERRLCIEQNNKGLSLVRQCQLLGISRSSLYRTAAGESPENLNLMHLLDQIYTECPFFGSRQMCFYLRRMGYPVNRKRIQRLMHLMRLEAIYPEPNLSQCCKQHRKFPYLLRNVDIIRPDQVWGTDITYLRLKDGFAYLVAFIDWYSRFVLSFEVSTTLDHHFCLSALGSALQIGRAEIHNSDQGVQFTSLPYTDAVLKSGMKLSMDGKGRALDNVFTERLWRTVKYENIYLKEYNSPKEASVGLKDYFEFYNYRRPHGSLKGKSPAEVYRIMKG